MRIKIKKFMYNLDTGQYEHKKRINRFSTDINNTVILIGKN